MKAEQTFVAAVVTLSATCLNFKFFGLRFCKVTMAQRLNFCKIIF